jgi:uncharacterized protein with ATP-grasp and redox domains
VVDQPCIPKLPLPLPLLGCEAGTFTEYTITQRLPAIAQRVIAENAFSPEINRNLRELAAALPQGNLPNLTHTEGVDFPSWQKYLETYIGKRWLDIPWFFSETYFYRLILDITHYFVLGEYQYIDPFRLQKSQGLETTLDAIISLCCKVNQWLNESQQQPKPQLTSAIALLYFALWGNRADLSLWSAFTEDRSQFDIQNQLTHLLVDDSFAVSKLLTNPRKTENIRIDIVADNAGFELICDLCLGDFLLGSGLADRVYLHLKPHPTFVSDAMIKDVYDTKDFLTTVSHPQVKLFTQRLTEYLASERLVLTEDYFWTSPLAFWQIPAALKHQLAKSSLIVIKGDANYRRLLGDRHWDLSTNLADIVCYLPAPMVALRTLKSEVAAGLNPAIIAEVSKSDPDWLINGEWGLIQLVS